jgi:hypothetical protein
VQLNELQALNLDTIQDQLCVVAARHPMSRIGEEFQCLSQAFQARGVYHLLQSLDTTAFSMNLRRSAHARRFFLRKSREQASTDVIYTALSRTDAVFECIAGGDWRLALDVQALAPREWQPAGEYEEDFCYHSLVYACVATAVDGADQAIALAWRDRLTAVVEAIPNSAMDVSRLDVCTAMLAGDEPAFWAAFDVLVTVSGDAADAVPLVDGRVFEFPWLAADRYVSVELLAWVALARQRKLRPPQREYKRCPSVAWLHEPAGPAPDIFLELEAQFGL